MTPTPATNIRVASTANAATKLTRLAATALMGLLCAQMAAEAQAACKQPVYVIVHRCNDPNDGPNAIAEEGNNAIEADFSYGARSIFVDPEWAVDHDGVFPHSTYLSNWLADVNAEVHRPGTTLSLIFLDIKDPDGPLLELYTAMRNGLGPDINLLISIPDWSQRWQFNQIKDAINADPHAGVAIDFLDEADADQIQSNVQAFFWDIGISKYWFGDGLAAGLPTPDSVRTNMHDAIALRDSGNDCTNFHGAYTWTYETLSSFHEFLDMGVNGIFVNSPQCNGYASPLTATDPEEAVALAKSLPNRKYATPADNPFEHSVPEVTPPSSILVECAGAGGTPDTDPQIAAFLAGASASSAWCDDLQITNDAPGFVPVGVTTIVTFTAQDGSLCAKSNTGLASVTVVDTTPPTIACPPDIAVDPVSPAGTIVSFSASAHDGCDAGIVATCPASGNTFPVGSVTPVTCSVMDAWGNSSSCGLNVKVYSPKEVVANLQAKVDALVGLNNGQLVSLKAHLASILDSIDKNKQMPTCQKLAAFIAKVQQLMAANQLTPAQGQPLIDSAQNLRNTFGC